MRRSATGHYESKCLGSWRTDAASNGSEATGCGLRATGHVPGYTRHGLSIGRSSIDELVLVDHEALCVVGGGQHVARARVRRVDAAVHGAW